MSDAPQKRMLALAIGISDAPPLDYLSGAINGAKQFQFWAKQNGYEAKILTDEKQPVTIQRLRAILEAMLTPDPARPEIPTARMLLYFAGHGLIREAEEGLWLLSDWKKELRAVGVETLRRRFTLFYGIPQVAIFADACRSLSTDISTLDLNPEPVLGSGPALAALNPAIDKFIAAQDTKETFMIPGDTPEQDRCLFSGVLMEGLWGTPAAISTFFPGKVTTQSLADFLVDEVPKRARTYKRTLVPTVNRGFPLGADVYYSEIQPPPPAPIFDPWTDPSLVIGMGLPSAPKTDLRSDSFGVAASTHQGSGGSGVPSFVRKTDPGQTLLARMQNQQVPENFETRSGFALDGGPIRAVWAYPSLVAQSAGRPDWWRVGRPGQQHLINPTSVLIELNSGLFLALAVMPWFIAALVSEDRGLQGISYRDLSYGAEYEDTGNLAAKAMGRLESGSLRADSIADLAVELRRYKHVDPILGVITAYLYDSIGSVDDIRRLAYFYVACGQAIPYDIALLAQVTGRRNPAGLLEIDIPVVPARAALTEKETQYDWTCQATYAVTGIVAGLWPWMHQGWAFLDAPSDRELGLVDPNIVAFAPQLTTARFTTFNFNPEGGAALVQYIGLVAFPIH